MGPTQFGASIRGLAFAMAQQGRVNANEVLATAAADRMRAGALQAVQPRPSAATTDEQIREQVLARRGVDAVDLIRLSPVARLQVEASIASETAVRARAAGTLFDLRV